MHARSIVLSFVALTVLALTGTAQAQEAHGFGVGAGILSVGSTFTGAPLVLTYDTGPVLVDAYAGMALATDDGSGGDTDLGIIAGLTAHVVVHRTDQSDFSLGAGAGILHIHEDTTTDALLLDAGARIRLFLVPNVALTAGAGLAAIVQEGSDVVIVGGRLVGNAGVVYYF